MITLSFNVNAPHTWPAPQTISDTTASASPTTGALVVAGGIGAAQAWLQNTTSGAASTNPNQAQVIITNTAGANTSFLAVSTSAPSGASTAVNSGIKGRSDLFGGATNMPAELAGLNGESRINAGAAAGTIAQADGCRVGVNNNNATVTVTSAAGYRAYSPVATGPITTAAGVIVNNQKVAGVTNAYGIFIGNQSAGGYAISTGTGLVSFGDAVSTSSSVRTGTFTVAGLAALGGVAGMRAFVTDALAPAFGVAVAAGGAVGVPVYHDGVSWKVG